MKLSKKDLGIIEPKPEPPAPEKVVEIREVKVPAVEQSTIIASVNSSISAKLTAFTAEINNTLSSVSGSVQDVLKAVSAERPKREWVLKIKRDSNSIIDHVKVLEL